MSNKSKTSKKDKKKIQKQLNENVTPSIKEQTSEAKSRMQAEDFKKNVTPKKAEQKRTPEEIEAERNMSSFQRYIRSIKEGWELEKQTMATMEKRREKIGYFLYYHKWHVIIPLIFLFVLIYGTVALVTHKKSAYTCVMVNDSYNQTFKDAFHSEMESSITYDKKKNQLQLSPFSTDISNAEPGYYGNDAGMQNIFALLIDSKIDSMLADKNIIEWFSKDDNFCDLKETLPNDLYSDLEPYMITLTNSKGDEYIGAIDFSNVPVMTEGKSHLKTPTFAISNTTKHLDGSIELLKHLFKLD